MIDDIMEDVAVLRQIQWPTPFQNQIPVIVNKNPELAPAPSNPPPAPQIASTLKGTAVGYQFSFYQVDTLPTGATNVIDSYRVYRSLTNTASRNLIQTIKHDPTATGAVTVTDTIRSADGSNYWYWVSSVDTAGQESSLTAAQCSSAVPGAIGSTPYSNTGSFTYSATSTSITWSWDLNTNPIRRADGTTTSGGTGNRAITGLSPSTDYFFFPYWDEDAQAVAWVSGGLGSPSYAFSASTQAILASQNLRNRIPLSTESTGMKGSTPGSGTSTGSGGGGGGGGGAKIVL